MKMRAEVLTPWEQGPMALDPSIINHYSIDSMTDVTGQPSENLIPEPNLTAVEIVCEDTVLDLIEADPNYQVLWSEEQ